MPDGYMDAAAAPVPAAGNDTPRAELIEAIENLRGRVIDGRLARLPSRPNIAVIADALLPLIREHTAAAVKAERERAETAEAEVERLTDWKESAMTVMSGLQDLGKELGLPLGESITGTLAAEMAHRLRTRADTAESAIERVRALPLDAEAKAKVAAALDGSEAP